MMKHAQEELTLAHNNPAPFKFTTKYTGEIMDLVNRARDERDAAGPLEEEEEGKETFTAAQTREANRAVLQKAKEVEAENRKLKSQLDQHETEMNMIKSVMLARFKGREVDVTSLTPETRGMLGQFARDTGEKELEQHIIGDQDHTVPPSGSSRSGLPQPVADHHPVPRQHRKHSGKEGTPPPSDMYKDVLGSGEVIEDQSK